MALVPAHLGLWLWLWHYLRQRLLLWYIHGLWFFCSSPYLGHYSGGIVSCDLDSGHCLGCSFGSGPILSHNLGSSHILSCNVAPFLSWFPTSAATPSWDVLSDLAPAWIVTSNSVPSWVTSFGTDALIPSQHVLWTHLGLWLRLWPNSGLCFWLRFSLQYCPKSRSQFQAQHQLSWQLWLHPHLGLQLASGAILVCYFGSIPLHRRLLQLWPLLLVVTLAPAPPSAATFAPTSAWAEILAPAHDWVISLALVHIWAFFCLQPHLRLLI